MKNHPFDPTSSGKICSCGRFQSDPIHTLRTEDNLAVLQDTDVMPFGKYAASRTLMQDVPASYLHWLYTNKNDNIQRDLKLNTPQGKVARYIKANLAHLKKEHPDGIWD